MLILPDPTQPVDTPGFLGSWRSFVGTPKVPLAMRRFNGPALGSVVEGEGLGADAVHQFFPIVLLVDPSSLPLSDAAAGLRFLNAGFKEEHFADLCASPDFGVSLDRLEIVGFAALEEGAEPDPGTGLLQFKLDLKIHALPPLPSRSIGEIAAAQAAEFAAEDERAVLGPSNAGETVLVDATSDVLSPPRLVYKGTPWKGTSWEVEWYSAGGVSVEEDPSAEPEPCVSKEPLTIVRVEGSGVGAKVVITDGKMSKKTGKPNEWFCGNPSDDSDTLLRPPPPLYVMALGQGEQCR
jgi:hypothetical protein